MRYPDINRLKFYGWVGLAYLVLSSFGDLVSHTDTFSGRLVNQIWRALFITAANIVFFEYTLPFVRQHWKKVFAPLAALGGQFLLFSFGMYAWRAIGIQLYIWTPYTTYEKFLDGVCDQFSSNVFSLFFFAIIRHVYDYIQLRQTAQQLRIEKQEAELNYLKSQTNPHFLFNTLNNIYALSKDKSDLTPESILRLSKILRFMLYEAGGAYIAIEKELKIIGDYIALEQLRYDDSLRVNFNYDVEDMRQALPPLLLIPLVENAFKHGAAETRRQPFVDIHLSVRERHLAFFVKNSTEEPAGEERVKENIGLSNLRRQLELLYTDYQLSVHQSDHQFTATLKINLASHV
ncbi:MAG: histidine kinase [Haliscomenobacteraceae bacterium CHB4]|nr:hypothetical protein [Saprospiraceae bacterium]MCE7922765.1 histidine kinase [Haliscomenobacteraceae bacterium CHB4]